MNYVLNAGEGGYCRKELLYLCLVCGLSETFWLVTVGNGMTRDKSWSDPALLCHCVNRSADLQEYPKSNV